MIVVDEYLAVLAVGGEWPRGLPDDQDLVVPSSRHWRLLQRIYRPATGPLSQLLAALSPAACDAVRYPHPEVLQVLDSRPLLDEAAQLAARHGGGWLIAETLAAGLTFGRTLWFGRERNVGRIIATAARDLDIDLRVIE